ncbi:unnamed protein product [Rotaria sp. Silwood1]|nr:unnamed protein product [Rotaria sp. Silwood1]CAF5071312.1 unnamed protein product [Rotaria sp. Silwood1]
MFTCRGCSKSFCLTHTNQHREIVEKQMNEIILNHNYLKQQIINEEPNQYHQILIEQIDQWEKESINKIHHTANEIRQQLINKTREYHDNLKEKLTPLTQEITKARHDGNFFENDLQQWAYTIKNLQYSFLQQENIQISIDNNTNSFISKISLTNKLNNSMISLINNNQIENSRNFNLTKEYSSGDHLLRFQLELYETSDSVIMGIISTSKSKNVNPDKNPTFYGWSTNNFVYLHGIAYSNFNGYENDIEKNDVFSITS